MRIGIVFLLISAFLLLAGCAAPAPATMPPPVPTPAETPAPAPTRTKAPTPTVDCLSLGGEVERITLQSDAMGYPYTVSVYTPPCYEEGAAGGYPVLYLLHGQNMDDTFWLSLGAREIADELIAAGAPPFLMVMPFEVKNFDFPVESKFYDAVLNELIPWVEVSYNACTRRECRAVGGVSRGGGWAMRLAMRNFDLFGAVGGHSMGVMAGDWWQAQKHLLTRTVEEYPRIYIDRGEDDYLKGDIDSFEQVLTQNSILHEFHVDPGLHDVAYWRLHVRDYLEWYAQGWQ